MCGLRPAQLTYLLTGSEHHRNQKSTGSFSAQLQGHYLIVGQKGYARVRHQRSFARRQHPPEGHASFHNSTPPTYIASIIALCYSVALYAFGSARQQHHIANGACVVVDSLGDVRVGVDLDALCVMEDPAATTSGASPAVSMGSGDTQTWLDLVFPRLRAPTFSLHCPHTSNIEIAHGGVPPLRQRLAAQLFSLRSETHSRRQYPLFIPTPHPYPETPKSSYIGSRGRHGGGCAQRGQCHIHA